VAEARGVPWSPISGAAASSAGWHEAGGGPARKRAHDDFAAVAAI
jgi:prolyl oligopeptidase PreP (S9A serine peptidase family)